MSLPMMVRICGTAEPALVVELQAVAVGPNVTLTTDKVDWGKANVLQHHYCKSFMSLLYRWKMRLRSMINDRLKHLLGSYHKIPDLLQCLAKAKVRLRQLLDTQ